MKIILGVTGSIAAFRACELVLLLRKSGHEVRVVLTDGAQRFVTPLTFETLSQQPVGVSLWDQPAHGPVEHIALAQWPDAIVVAPCTANAIARMAHGFADDLLTTVILARRPETPVVLAPAMNTRMWENPIVRRNLALLTEGEGRFVVVPPRESLLACGDYGEGALAEVAEIAAAVERAGACRET